MTKLFVWPAIAAIIYTIVSWCVSVNNMTLNILGHNALDLPIFYILFFGANISWNMAGDTLRTMGKWSISWLAWSFSAIVFLCGVGYYFFIGWRVLILVFGFAILTCGLLVVSRLFAKVRRV